MPNTSHLLLIDFGKLLKHQMLSNLQTLGPRTARFVQQSLAWLTITGSPVSMKNRISWVRFIRVEMVISVGHCCKAATVHPYDHKVLLIL